MTTAQTPECKLFWQNMVTRAKAEVHDYNWVADETFIQLTNFLNTAAPEVLQIVETTEELVELIDAVKTSGEIYFKDIDTPMDTTS